MQGLKRLNDTLAWKEEQQPDKIVCHRCRDRDDPHYMHVCGFDVEGRPILYSVFNLAENRGIEENRKHMLSTFEQVCVTSFFSHTASLCGCLLIDLQPIMLLSSESLAPVQEGTRIVV